jgi:hypothetical protein
MMFPGSKDHEHGASMETIAQSKIFAANILALFLLYVVASILSYQVGLHLGIQWTAIFEDMTHLQLGQARISITPESITWF